MTRQWLAPPAMMCRQHLLGEHAEAHMFVAKMAKGYSLQGFSDGSMFFGAKFVKLRHDMLASYLAGHKTPLDITADMVERYPLEEPKWHDYHKSLSDLLERCDRCRGLSYDNLPV